MEDRCIVLRWRGALKINRIIRALYAYFRCGLELKRERLYAFKFFIVLLGIG